MLHFHKAVDKSVEIRFSCKSENHGNLENVTGCKAPLKSLLKHTRRLTEHLAKQKKFCAFKTISRRNHWIYLSKKSKYGTLF